MWIIEFKEKNYEKKYFGSYPFKRRIYCGNDAYEE